MKKQFRKFLSLLLIAALLVQLLPASVFAQETDSTQTDDVDVIGLADSSGSAPEDTLQNAKILFEEESLREENVKHFRMDDGSYIAVQYGTPVHYQQDGQWVDYDNTLHEVNTFDGKGVSHYTVTNGDSTRVFAADANAEVLLALQKGSYSLSLTPVREPDAEIPVIPNLPVEMEILSNEAGTGVDLQTDQNSDISMEQLQPVQPASVLCYSGSGQEAINGISLQDASSVYAQAQPDTMYSALEYAGALNGATLRYENFGNTVKESIVIHGPQETYSYSFTLETDGLTPILQADDSIYLTAPDGEIIYTIPAPYMIDGNKEYSYDASYSVSGSGNTYILTVTADEDWMNAPERSFPVVLDPTFEEPTDTQALAACFVRSGFPDSQDATDKSLYAGVFNNNNKKTRSYFHVNELPNIPGGCEINNVKLKLHYYAISPDSSASSVDVGIYGLTHAGGLNGISDATAWNQWIDSLTWENVESGSAVHDDILVDKVTLNWHNIDSEQYWDITTLAYKWYGEREKNMGFVLKAVDENNAIARASFFGPEQTFTKPAIIVTYKNTVGIESYYNYQTFGHGRAGVSYISDYSMQNTLVVPVIQSSSEVMPFALNLVYNSTYGGRYFTDDSGNGKEARMLHTKDYSDMLLYVGWKLSAQQTVVPFSKNNVDYLIYTDEDGTEHYFIDENGDGIYEDEDGLKCEITKNGENYTMSNRKDYKWYFAKGFLTWEEDAYGNRIDYHYDGSTSRLLYISRTNVGAEPEILVTLSYGWNKNGTMIMEEFPSSFTDQYGRVTQLQYSSDGSICYLRKIIFPDEQYAEYGYSVDHMGDHQNGYRLTRVYDAESQYGMEFSYSYNGDIRNLYEYVSSSRVYGTKIHGYKRSPSQTVYRYYGKDQAVDPTGEDGQTHGDDQLMFCVLDSCGRTVSCYVTDSSEEQVLGVSAVEFTENNGTDKRNNSITAAASAGLQGINLLANSSGEAEDSSWTNYTSNTTSANVYIGNKSLKVTNNTMDQTVSLDAGEAYTFSAYVKKTAGTEAHLSILTDDGEVLASSEPLNYDASGVNNGWVRLSVTYIPEYTDEHRVAVVATGTAYADALQLEKGEAASAYNPVDDPSFERTIQWISDGSSNTAWRRTGTAEIYTETNNASGNSNENVEKPTTYFGSHMAELSSLSESQRVYQIIYLNMPLETSSFLLSAWAKGAADPQSVEEKDADSDLQSAEEDTDSDLQSAEEDTDSDPYFGIAIRLYFSDDTSEIHYKSFDPYCHDWQYVQDIISPDKENNEAGTITITHVTIAVAYDNNINTAYVDNVSLRLTQAQTYAYDAEGNVDTAALTGDGVEDAEYDDNTGDLIKYTAPNGIVFNYTSNAEHSIIQEAGAGTVTDYDYGDDDDDDDISGFLKSTKLSAAPPKDSTAEADPRYIKTSATSTADQNFTASVTDSAGNTSSYIYNTGRLEYATNPKGQTTTYTYYHQNDRSKNTYISGIAAIDYTYDKGQLSQLQRKTFPYVGAPQSEAVYQDYNFAFNAWGQRTSVAVGNQTLVTDEYEDVTKSATATTKGGGNKTQTTYANGDSVSYFYDEFDRLIKAVYNDSGKYVEYSYNNEGALSKLVHCRSNGNVIATYEFERDNLGRLIRSRQLNGNNGTVQRTEHLYDTIGRLSTQRWTVGNKSYSESYIYNDGENGNGALNTVTLGTGDQMCFAYDPLNRLETATVKQGDSTLYTTSYKYWASDTPEGEAPDANRTSNEVKFQHTELADETVIAGNQYVYDELGNIIALYEYEPKGTYQYRRLSVEYTYDDQSQLLSETYYSYGDDDGPNNAEIVTWYYTYDTAGNILSRTGRSYTKTNGVITQETSIDAKTYSYSTGDWKDLLTSVTVGNTTHTLQYDQSGNPTTYGNGEQLYTNLTWEHGRQLASLTTNGKTYTYEYDMEGIRTQKVGDGEQHDYITQNGKVVREHITSYNGWDWVLDFIYDNCGRPFALNFSTNGGSTFTTYYYVLNLQGDVVALLNAGGTVVACYSYNAWGEPLSVTDGSGKAITNTMDIAHINPLRYRGYYYDTETGFYYVSSRYYDPEIGRWINADSQLNTSLGVLGLNQFSYCLNNPVNMGDYGGNKPGDLFDTMDEAARDFAEYINETSIEVDREYASYIYTKTVWETKTVTYYNPNLFGNNLLSRFWNYIFGGGISKTVKKRVQVTKYTYVKPAKGTAHGSIIPINWFGMHNQVALLHTHGAYSPGYGNDVFSPTDKNLANRKNMPIYVATPLGTLRKYNPSNGTDIVLYDDLPFDPNHPGR